MAYVLITGHPRSGSKWLATRLQACQKLGKTFVAHEWCAGSDYYLTKKLMLGQVDNAWFMQLVDRMSFIQGAAAGFRGIVEVAPCARYLAAAIAAAAHGPTKHVFHLVRDGRRVIPSMLARGHYRPGKPSPSGEFPIAHGKTRVETHIRLWDQAVNVCEPFPELRHEDLVDDQQAPGAYGGPGLYTLADLFDPDEWELIVDAWDTTPINTTKKPGPPFERWRMSDREEFWFRCGDAMLRHGYKP